MTYTLLKICKIKYFYKLINWNKFVLQNKITVSGTRQQKIKKIIIQYGLKQQDVLESLKLWLKIKNQ